MPHLVARGPPHCPSSFTITCIPSQVTFLRSRTSYRVATPFHRCGGPPPDTASHPQHTCIAPAAHPHCTRSTPASYVPAARCRACSMPASYIPVARWHCASVVLAVSPCCTCSIPALCPQRAGIIPTARRHRARSAPALCPRLVGVVSTARTVQPVLKKAYLLAKDVVVWGVLRWWWCSGGPVRVGGGGTCEMVHFPP